MMALLAFSCNQANKKETSAADDQGQEINMENLVEVSIPVHGMTCEGCENAVKKSVQKLSGIAEITASHIDSIAEVKYDSSAVTLAEIEEKIEEAGYTVANF